MKRTHYLLSDIGAAPKAAARVRTLQVALLGWLFGALLALPAILLFPLPVASSFVPVDPPGVGTTAISPGKQVVKLSARVLLRLEEAEAREPDAHLRDDIRIAWITTLNAWRNEPQPFVSATYAVLGIHPDRVWTAIVERRKAILGAEYKNFFVGERSPKKPVQSVRRMERKNDPAV